jgi:hypothetical protein
MYSLLAQDQMRLNEEQIRRQAAHAHERIALRRARRAAAKPTRVARLWLSLAGTVRRGGSAKPATGCRTV